MGVLIRNEELLKWWQDNNQLIKGTLASACLCDMVIIIYGRNDSILMWLATSML